MSYRLGVDVGGTFTDLLLINEQNGQIFTAKIASTPQDQSIGVLNGINRICEQSQVDPKEITRVMHGTTVSTNAVLTGKGAKVGLITSKGFKQTLQVARSFCPGGLGGWVHYVKKPLLAPLELTIEANERIGTDGSVVHSLDEAALKEDLVRLRATGEVEALTICFINSYINGVHEQQAYHLASEIFDDIPISISSEIVPEMQEYERTETTVVNSYVRPEVSEYVNNLQSALKESMGDGVHLSILRSDGGLASARASAERPVNMLMSGPAGGVTGAIHFCTRGGFKNIITFDMGGTSTDVALIQNSKPKVRRETRIGDVVVRAPSVDVRTVGAGGGSIAFVPELTKALRVGPESAGAEPGPAAYMKGGTEPTVCDANVVLGYLPSDIQLGGAMSIDKTAAVAVVKKVADAMSISIEDAAEGIVKIANEAMLGALRLVSVEQGFDPRDFSLVGFGGAGPLHANALGILTQAWPVIIPPGPGVLCAFGDATTVVKDEATRTFVKPMKDLSKEELQSELQELKLKATESLVADGILPEHQIISYQADVRYAGQAFQLTIDFSEEQLAEQGVDFLIKQFNDEHKQLFTFSLDEGHEIVMVRALVHTDDKPVVELKTGDAATSLADCKVHDTRIYYDGKYHDAVIYERNRLSVGLVIPGPAIVSEMDSTTVVLPGYQAHRDNVGNLLINKI